MFTGDDFNYLGLIDGRRRSGTPTRCSAPSRPSPRPPRRRSRPSTPATRPRTGEILGPTEELGRHVFAAPTFYYKTGVAFLSWLNGHQPAFQMVGGLHSARSLPHLSDARAAGRPGRARSSDPDSPPQRLERAASRAARRRDAPDAVRRRSTRGSRSTRRRSSTPTSPTRAARSPREAGIASDRAVARAGGRGRPRRGRRAWSPTPGCGCRRLCRGGFFTAADDAGRRAALDDNRRGDRGDGDAGRGRRARLGARARARRRRAARRRPRPRRRAGPRARRRSARWSTDAAAAGVVLAIEPLHPMYAADRGVISTLGQALDVAAQFPADGGRRRRRHLPRLVGPAARRPGRRAGRSGRIATLPGVRLDHPARRRRPARRAG